MIIDRYYPIWGGAENQLRQLVPHLKKRGCQITILTRRWNKNMSAKKVVDDTYVFRVGCPGNHIFATAIYLIGLTQHVLRNRGNIDMIHTHGAAALGAFARILGWLIHKPNIVKIATAGRITKLRKNLFGRIILAIFKKSNAIICMTREIENELISIKITPDKIRYIKNAVDTNRFKRLDERQRKMWREDRGWDANDPITIFSGRLVYRKGVDILIETWEKVVRTHTNARLIILGSGENHHDSIEDQIRFTIEEKGLLNVYLEGFTNKPEIYLGISDILIVPSRKEGFSNVILEGMSSELATIATKIGGNVDLIKDKETGTLVPQDDLNSMAHMIINLINNLPQQENIGKNARGYIIQNLTFDKIANEFINLYKELN